MTQPTDFEKNLKLREKYMAQVGLFTDSQLKNFFPFYPEELGKDLFREAPSYSLYVNQDLLDSYSRCIVPRILSTVAVNDWIEKTLSFDSQLLQVIRVQ
ncbi:hypothetical protein LguiB_018159 [Lonicera macranthoides]